MRLAICVMALLTLCWLTPVPQVRAATEIKDKQKSLEDIRQLLATEEQKKDDLAREQREAEKQVKSARSELAELTANIRKNETRLKALASRIATLETEGAELSQRMEKDHGAMARTVLALERLRRVPPELMIIRPGAPLETAQTALLLRGVLPALQHRADLLGRDLESLRLIKTQLDIDQKESAATSSQLAKQKEELDKLVAEREQAFKTAHKAYKTSATRAEQLATEAASLTELMKKLQDDSQKQIGRAAEGLRTQKLQTSSKRKKGGRFARQAVWPVSGKKLSGFGDQDEMGAELEGMRIASAAGSIVVTPLEGVVKYAGTFRSYGQLVIVEHDSGYHSLI
ncbi:MAG: peptidoglycan DD-metalloendopeptidase family protein, partial [Alphaproteobacteria bacterium]|nr:peptidoglycan DD-metalloendopeptidase family protein [Alphaproteobacteria bacterium]